MNGKDEVKLMVTIVSRGHSDIVVRKLREEHIGLHYVSLGFGTATSEIMDYFGIGETEKDVLFSLVPETKANKIMERIRAGMDLHLPGRGIIFIMPLNAVSKIVERTLFNDLTESDREEREQMEEQAKYSLIVTVANRGYVDTVMEAATQAGARGGTVIHARGVGDEEAGSFFGISLQPEKDMILMLVPQKDKLAVMQAVGKAAGMLTKAHGILFSLPVENFGGIS